MTKALLLGLLLVVLAGLVAFELGERTDDKIVAEPVVQASPDAPHAVAAAADNRAMELRTILARPLFSLNRRPPSVAAAPVVAGAPPPSLPRVAGILLDGKQRSVIFAAAGGMRPLVVGEGGEVNGFRVQSIEDGQVTVVGPDGPRVLHPTFDPNPPQAQGGPGSGVAGQGMAGQGAPGGGIPGLPGLTGIPGLPNFPLPGGPIAR